MYQNEDLGFVYPNAVGDIQDRLGIYHTPAGCLRQSWRHQRLSAEPRPFNEFLGVYVMNLERIRCEDEDLLQDHYQLCLSCRRIHEE